MATISIADNDARIQYTQAVTANVTPLPIDFPFFELDDIKVIRTTSAGVDTVLSRGTGSGTFAVTGVAVDDGYSSGNITLGDTNDNTFTYTIYRDVPIARTTDFATSGPFNIASLNTELDKIYSVMQQVENANDRALTMPDSDGSASITLPTLNARKGKYLAFNASSGAAEIGGNVADTGTVATISANITTLAGISADVTTVAHLQDGTTTSNGISNLAGIHTAISGVNSISTQVQQAYTDRVAIQNASANATKAENYAIKVDGAVESSNHSSKAWAIGGTGVTDTAGSGSSKSWAVEADAVDGTEHSSKTYAISGSTLNAGSAKNWALGGGDSFSSTTAVGNTGLYSAKYWAEQAAASKTEFSNIYHGASSSDPTGGTVGAGDLYFNSSSNKLRYYTGSAWLNVEATDTSSFASNGFAIAVSIAL
tara:strand:- start:5785 stop:7062 length:1278 start_codon:yes stop_codon:yes gene_type:complete